MVTVRTMIDHERRRYAEGCRLLQDEGLTESDDPFGIREYSRDQQNLRNAGVPDAGRYHPHVVIALSDRDEVLGIAGVHPTPDWVRWALRSRTPKEDLDRALSFTNLGKMVVRPDLRGQGIGGKMLDHAVTVAAEDGYRTFTGFAEGDLERLVPFYRKHGMTVDVAGDGRPPEHIFGPMAPSITIQKKGYFFWCDLLD